MKFSAESQDFDKQLKKRVTKEPIIWFFTPKVFDDKNLQENLMIQILI